MKKYILIFLLIVAVSCKTLTNKEAEQFFLKTNPHYQIESVFASEGNDDQVYYHFRYKKPGESKLHEEVWLFMKQNDGTWKVINKEILYNKQEQ